MVIGSPSLYLVVSPLNAQFWGQVLPPFTLPVHDLEPTESLNEVGLLTLSVERLVSWRTMGRGQGGPLHSAPLRTLLVQLVYG